ncbi:hypothetical protein B1R32_12512 [Abditibacterium utsteinense]|uniref:Beta-galactosidase n=1 Tax=Abditibacterium utsteinense TaxID=1960156 RepID=A0A2S8SPD7_9BACT|nr:hypothetical protein [Abditibacterium utsteinense]PQV62663.1 hypothetical protein B1R32_12512 [Abditibacterium utsteinense]
MNFTLNTKSSFCYCAATSFFVAGAVLMAAPAQAQETYRYSLASQQEYGRKRGFKLAFEANNSTIPRQLGTLDLVMSVSDGKSWRFPKFRTNWQLDHEYQVKAVLGPKQSDLIVDGERVLQSAGGFLPSDAKGELSAGLDSRNIDGTTDYRVLQTALRVATDKGQAVNGTFPTLAQRPFAVFLFEPQTPLHLPWKSAPGETVTIETSFRLLRADAQTIAGLAPFVDKFGQSVHANWPQKIKSETQFQQAVMDEKQRESAWGQPADFDAYNGSTTAGWSEKPTGFFRTTKRNGFWWLVSPLGNPCFYVGVDTVTGTFEKTPIAGREAFFQDLPPRKGPFAPAWGAAGKAFGFTTANLIRKYGENWETASWKEAEYRLRAWGFSGLGKWSGITTQGAGPTQLPVQPVLRRGAVPTIGRMPDIFDETVRAAFRASLEKGITPHINNPYILGWSVGNEHEEIVLPTDIKAMLAKDATTPAKRALVDYALDHIYNGDTARLKAAWKIDGAIATREALQAATSQAPAGDIETLRRYFADQYYGYIYRTVKEIDPNHLYFGFWIGLGWWENDEDWRLIAKHADVVGYDVYRYDFHANQYAALIKETDKPTMCGEFSYPSWDGGARGNGAYGTFAPDDATAGQLYAKWVADAARDPHTVGMHWFQYRDQPIAGRGQSNRPLALAQDEHFAFGLVDITDRPKCDMIAPMRAANLSAVKTRVEASQNPGTK